MSTSLLTKHRYTVLQLLLRTLQVIIMVHYAFLFQSCQTGSTPSPRVPWNRMPCYEGPLLGFKLSRATSSGRILPRSLNRHFKPHFVRLPGSKKAIEGALHDLATAKLQKSFEDGPGGHGIRRKSRTPNGTTMSDVIGKKREKNKPTLCFCFALCATLSKAFEGPS